MLFDMLRFTETVSLNQLSATPSLELAMRSSGSLAGVTSPGVLHGLMQNFDRATPPSALLL